MKGILSVRYYEQWFIKNASKHSSLFGGRDMLLDVTLDLRELIIKWDLII